MGRKKLKFKRKTALPSGATDPNPTPSSNPFEDAVAHLQKHEM
jgi:hypothetical protein